MLLEEKNKLISDAKKATLLRRKNQVCKTFLAKINKNSLNNDQKEALIMFFLEAKWIYNYLLANKDGLFEVKTKYKELNKITHLDKDKNEVEVIINHIKSSIKQEIIQQIINQIKGLAVLKEHGNNVGELKFKTEVNSVPLKQYGVTHYVKGNTIKIQGIKKPIRVCGLKQLSKYKNIDYANAKLIFNGYDYFVALTCFIDKEETIENNKFENDIIGIDFGCSDTITLSNGEKIDIKIEESERLKKLQASLARKQKGSNNYEKIKTLIRKEHNHITNKKNDISKQIAHKILSTNKVVVTQNDNFNGWKTAKGKNRSIQHSILGRIKSIFKYSNQVVFLEQWFPTSKQCTECGTKNDNLQEKDRIFVCPKCGYTEDRDIHAAKNMIYYYDKVKDTLGTSDTSKLVTYRSYKELVAEQESTTSLALC